MAHAQIDEYYIPFLHLLTRNELVVFIYLLRKRNGQTKKCNPRLSTIAEETQLKAPRITEAVKGLEAKNWIVRLDSGDFIINEKLTQCVTTQVTNCVRKSYALRKSKLRIAEVEVTQCVSEIKGIEQTIEETRNETKERDNTISANAAAAKKTGRKKNADAKLKTRPDLSSDDFLALLKTLPENIGIDIDRLFGKMVKWCADNSETASRKRLLNWIDREKLDSPILVQRPPEPEPPRIRTQEEKQRDFDRQHYANRKSHVVFVRAIQ